MPVVPNPSISETLAALGRRLEAVETRLEALQAISAETRQLLGTSATAMPDGRMLVQTLHGVKFLIDPADRIMAAQMVVYRQWEPELSSFFRHLVTPASVVVDVGANFGYFTCLSGALIGAGGSGRVIAIEPNPAMVELIHANGEINWSMAPIEIIEAAAGAEAGSAVLNVHPQRAANASLTPGEGEAVEVRLVRIDDIVPDGLAVDLMKIDVEGHEAGVLLGARRTIGASPEITLVVEWSLGQMTAAGTEPERMLALFDELELEPFALRPRPDFSHATRLAPETLLRIPYDNIVLRRR
jgi:FkbM family methyltransferase